MSIVSMQLLSLAVCVLFFYQITIMLFLPLKRWRVLYRESVLHKIIVWISMIGLLVLISYLFLSGSFQLFYSALISILPYILLAFGIMCVLFLRSSYKKLWIGRRLFIVLLSLACIIQIGFDWIGHKKAGDFLKSHDNNQKIATRSYFQEYRSVVSQNIAASNSIANSFYECALEFENDTIPLVYQRKIFDRLSILKDSAIQCFNSMSRLAPPYEGEHGFKETQSTMVDGLKSNIDVMDAYFELLNKRQDLKASVNISDWFKTARLKFVKTGQLLDQGIHTLDDKVKE